LQTTIHSEDTNEVFTTDVRAVFGATSNDDLETTLKEIQEKITLPAHLPREQRSILRDRKKKNYIEQNPVVIEIEGLVHKYTSLVLAKDMPNSKHIFKQAIKNMHTREDWANLETLLSGFKKAGIALKPKHYGFASRRAIASEQLYSLIECARHVQDTGYLLSANGESGFVVLLALAHRATTENHAQTIKWLENVQDILERSPHKELSNINDLRSSKLASGLMLSARIADVQASESPSEAQMNNLSDEVERARALWTRALDAQNESLQLEIDELGLNSLRRITRTQADGTTTYTAMSFHTMSPSRVVAIISHNIKAFESVASVTAQTCDPLPEAGKRLDAYLTERITEGAQLDSHLQAKIPVLAGVYQEIVGRAPTWAELATQ
jgi:hypothetical protein